MPTLWSPKPVNMLWLHSIRDFADMIKIIVLEVGRSSWIMWMCSIQSYEPLKAEKFLWLLSERCNRREGQQIGEAEKFKMWEELKPLGRWKERGHKPRNELTSSVTESKLILRATKRANHSGNKVLGRGTASLFRASRSRRRQTSALKRLSPPAMAFSLLLY